MGTAYTYSFSHGNTVTGSSIDPLESELTTEDGNRLRIRLYTPATPLPSDPIVLVHGLLSSSDIFDVPNANHVSLARRLRDQGYTVITYDQRGAGGSQTKNWNFGLAEIALLDLPTVIKHAMDVTGSQKVILGGHSLGGVQIYLLMCYAAISRKPKIAIDLSNIGACFTMASPVQLTPSISPWCLIRAKWNTYYSLLDPDGDGRISPADFVRVQAGFFRSFWASLLHPGIIRYFMKFGGQYKIVAAVLKRLPIPSLLFRNTDFDTRVFKGILASKVLDAGPLQLLTEVRAAIESNGRLKVKYLAEDITLPDSLEQVKSMRILTITSEMDNFVPPTDVRAIHSYIANGTSIVTETDLGIGSGHSGYLFKPNLHDLVFNQILKFLRSL
jgi:pimeloyl-ACP methyl ester carboxylesterase